MGSELVCLVCAVELEFELVSVDSFQRRRSDSVDGRSGQYDYCVLS